MNFEKLLKDLMIKGDLESIWKYIRIKVKFVNMSLMVQKDIKKLLINNLFY